jgi:hypothetical protein
MKRVWTALKRKTAHKHPDALTCDTFLTFKIPIKHDSYYWALMRCIATTTSQTCVDITNCTSCHSN